MSNLLTTAGHFPLLILIGRPASGKSEIIDYLMRVEFEERVKRFRIGELEVLDDFPMLWTWFEEDHILEKEFHKPRLHTDPKGYFKHNYLWNLLIRRLELDYKKRLKDNPQHMGKKTIIIEFSRGAEHGGYTQALNNFSEDISKSASILYVNVSYQESLRKNRLRFNPQRPHSILEHAMPDEKLENLYFEDDFHKLAGSNPSILTLDSGRFPYAVFENEDDVTSGDADTLGVRLELTLNRLWEVYKSPTNLLPDEPKGAQG
jgi:hypothetical protein